jgi:hypothetical protein
VATDRARACDNAGKYSRHQVRARGPSSSLFSPRRCFLPANSSSSAPPRGCPPPVCAPRRGSEAAPKCARSGARASCARTCRAMLTLHNKASLKHVLFRGTATRIAPRIARCGGHPRLSLSSSLSSPLLPCTRQSSSGVPRSPPRAIPPARAALGRAKEPLLTEM